jgi:hypothetical protein
MVIPTVSLLPPANMINIHDWVYLLGFTDRIVSFWLAYTCNKSLHKLIHLGLSLDAIGRLAHEVLITLISFKPSLITGNWQSSRRRNILPRLNKTNTSVSRAVIYLWSVAVEMY